MKNKRWIGNIDCVSIINKMFVFCPIIMNLVYNSIILNNLLSLPFHILLLRIKAILSCFFFHLDKSRIALVLNKRFKYYIIRIFHWKEFSIETFTLKLFSNIIKNFVHPYIYETLFGSLYLLLLSYFKFSLLFSKFLYRMAK